MVSQLNADYELRTYRELWKNILFIKSAGQEFWMWIKGKY